MYYSLYNILFVTLFIYISNGSFVPDDKIFSVDWISPETLRDDMLLQRETVIMTNHNKDQYSCSIPIIEDNQEKDEHDYTGPSEYELLSGLFKENICSNKVDSYWAYELCHGTSLRQYHDEPQEPNQEFFLGMNGNNMDVKYHLQKRQKIEENEYESYGVPLNDGTVCDLTGRHRKVMVYYVCDEGRVPEIYSLKEVATCEYELVVITGVLCKHPRYKVKKNKVRSIECQPIDSSPRVPDKLNPAPPVEEPVQMKGPGIKTSTYNMEGNTLTLKMTSEEIQKIIDGKSLEEVISPEEKKLEESKVIDESKITEHELIENTRFLKQFVEGKSCIHGGTGWWKHELCLGKSVVQYHEANNGRRETIIQLGTWNREEHHKWLLRHPSKAPTKDKKSISLFYSNGDKCDVTGQFRNTEVKLKCKTKGKTESISVFLMEVKTCEYILVVESWKLCSLIELGKGPDQFDNIDL